MDEVEGRDMEKGTAVKTVEHPKTMIENEAPIGKDVPGISGTTHTGDTRRVKKSTTWQDGKTTQHRHRHESRVTSALSV